MISADSNAHPAWRVTTYAYVDNNPLRWSDPQGLAPMGPHPLGGAFHGRRSPSDIYNDAMKDARSRFPGSTLHNGPGDAYRHCLASCMMTQENSEAEAAFLGWANEKRGDWTHGQEKGEREMDDANNAAGRVCGTMANSRQDCVNSCLNAPLTQSYPAGSTGYWY